MCDLICDIVTFCVWSYDMGKTNASDKILSKTKKREHMEIKEMFT